MGELLGKLVELSHHDVEEILQEQRSSRSRFGDIAVAWGLCQPQHVWKAWYDQLSSELQRVDLAQCGIDAQATACVPREIAVEFHVIPVRLTQDEIVLATDECSCARALCELPRRLGKQVKFVLADSLQIDRAIKQYYSAPITPHA
jgi:type IV pilus assembly protein PilB